MNKILLVSFLAGLGTTFGAAAVLLWGKPSARSVAFFLGFAGGIMAGVVFFDLIPGALAFGSWVSTSLGFLGGVALLSALDSLLGYLLRPEGFGPNSPRKMGYLIAIGIALHDLPEGFAIAAGHATPGTLGLTIALAIGLHNIPEGMAIAIPLTMGGVKTMQILGTAVLVSFFTPMGTLVGLYLLSISAEFVSLLLSLAGGAMFYLLLDELLPGARSYDLPFSLGGLMVGIGLMIIMSWWLH